MAYHETATSIGALAGIEVMQADYVGFFTNRHGEPMVFHQVPGQPHATFAHADLGWDRRDITPQMLRPGGTGDTLVERAPGVSDVVLNAEEFAWLTACFQASAHLRAGA
jgi:hypothetical protein